MIILTNSVSQTIGPGQSLSFDTETMHTGSAESWNEGDEKVVLRQKQAIYELHFSANATSSEGELASLALAIDGNALTESTMSLSGTDICNVATGCAAKTGDVRVECTVVNIGDSIMSVENPLLFVKRIA